MKDSSQRVSVQSSKQLSAQSPSKVWLLAGLLIVVCVTVVVAHWPVLSAQALALDDDQYIQENILVQNPSWASARRFLTEILEPSTVGGYYQPLAMISLMVDYACGGRENDLMPFHRTSLALHVVNTALVISLLYLLFGQVWAAAVLGLLFGLHPLTVEPIAWVSDRKTLLATFFALFCLLLYVRSVHKNNWKLRTACLIMYILALLSKPTTVPLPLLMILIDFWPLGRLSGKTVVEKWPYFITGGISIIITFVSQSRAGIVNLPSAYGPQRIPLIICHNIVFYLYKIIWPVNLSSHYAFPEPLGLSDPMVLAGVIGTCVLIPLLVLSLRWTRGIFAGCLFFFVAIFPTLGVVGFTNVIAADKYVYLPLFGLLMILTFAWTRISGAGTTGKFARQHVMVAGIVFILAVAVGGTVVTRRHLRHWRNTIGLYEHMLTITPNAAPLHNNLGGVLQSQGRLDEAINCYRKALRNQPNNYETHSNLGSALKEQGKFDEAIDHLRTALKIKPDYANAHNNLGSVFKAQGGFEEAISHFREALRIEPDSRTAYNNLGLVLQTQGNPAEAIRHFHKVLQINPNNAKAYNNLGITLHAQGKYDKAIDCYRKAIQIKPDRSDAYVNLGITLQAQGKVDEAISLYYKALQIKANDAMAHYNLGTAFQAQGKLDEAIKCYRKALKIKPYDLNIHGNLGSALQLQGKFNEAIIHHRRAIEIQPDSAKAHFNLGLTLRKMDRPTEALTHFQEAVRYEPDWPSCLDCLAWILATHPDPKLRDTNRAIDLAERAAALSGRQYPGILNTLATAYASANRFDQAVTTAEEALERASAKQAESLANYIRERLELYRQGKR